MSFWVFIPIPVSCTIVSPEICKIYLSIICRFLQYIENVFVFYVIPIVCKVDGSITDLVSFYVLWGYIIFSLDFSFDLIYCYMFPLKTASSDLGKIRFHDIYFHFILYYIWNDTGDILNMYDSHYARKCIKFQLKNSAIWLTGFICDANFHF